MANKPDAQPVADAPETPAPDPVLGARRLLVWVLGFVLGGLLAALSFAVFPGLFNKPAIALNATVPISVLELPLLPLVTLPLGFLCVIWLDYFMGTKILPD